MPSPGAPFKRLSERSDLEWTPARLFSARAALFC